MLVLWADINAAPPVSLLIGALVAFGAGCLVTWAYCLRLVSLDGRVNLFKKRLGASKEELLQARQELETMRAQLELLGTAQIPLAESSLDNGDDAMGGSSYMPNVQIPPTHYNWGPAEIRVKIGRMF